MPLLSSKHAIGKVGLIVAVLAIMLVGSVIGIEFKPNLINNSTSGSTPVVSQPSVASSVVAKSANLDSNGHLIVDILNNIGSSTESIQVVATCAPDYSQCQTLSTSPVTFVLPSGKEYVANLTLPYFCFVSFVTCSLAKPVIGQSYYFKVSVALNNGHSDNLNVAALANGTYPFSNTNTPLQDIFTLTKLNSASILIFQNLTATMSVSFTLNHTGVYTGVSNNFATNLLNTTSFSFGLGQRNTLATASTCTSTCPNVVEQPNFVQNLSATFSTVTTGVITGQYYVISIVISNYGSYFFWVSATSQ